MPSLRRAGRRERRLRGANSRPSPGPPTPRRCATAPRAAGFSAFTESVETDKGTLSRVRIGPVADRAAADQLKAQVQTKLGIAGIVRPATVTQAGIAPCAASSESSARAKWRPSCYDGLTVLQHRGQDAAGIATAEGGKLRVHKGNGLVRDVFDADSMAQLEGRVGIAHCRYPTAGSEGSDEAQPFY